MHTQQTIYAGPESWKKKKKERDTSPPSSFDIFQFGISPTQNTISSLSVALKLVCVPFLSFDSFLLLPPFFVSGLSVHSPSREKRSITFNEILQRIYTHVSSVSLFSSTRLGFGWAVGANPLFYFIFYFPCFYTCCVCAGLTLFFCFFPGRRPREEPGRVRHPPVRERSSTGPKINNNNKVDENFEESF